MNEQFYNEAALSLVINGKRFDWAEQYILGRQVKELGGIRHEDPLFLEVPAPWEPELIHNHTRVDLAREGLGTVRFVSREKHPDRIILTIETTNGTWENGEFNKHLTIGQLIEKVVNRFKFAKDGKYALRIKGQEKDLDKNATLESLHLKDHTVLVFIDLGSGA